MRDRNNNELISWLAFVIAVIALVFSIISYNRTSGSIVRQVDQELQPISITDDLSTARREAADALENVGLSIQNNASYDEAADEVKNVRADLSRAYINAKGEAAVGWNEIDLEFENIESELRQGSAEALDNLNALIASLRQDIQSSN